ncbi:MAG: hypothetical protein ACOCPM_05775 [Bacteroidales bacterium]
MEQTNSEGTKPSQNSNQEQSQEQGHTPGGNYQQPEAPRQNMNDYSVSVGEWIVTLIIAAVPLVNIIMLFVWGFGDNTKKSKANWAKAMLIFIAIGIVLWLIIALVVGSAFLASGF